MYSPLPFESPAAPLGLAPLPKAGLPGADGGGLFPELYSLRESLLSLTCAAAEAVGKAVQHFQGDDAWVIGPMPPCGEIAEGLEADARALLANSQLGLAQTDEIARVLKAAADLRAVARSARHGAQLAWLFRQEPGASAANALVRTVGEAALDVSLLVSAAMEKGDPLLARDAALAFRQVETARADAERYLWSDLAAFTYSPPLRKMTRAGVWFMSISGEGMARIAARHAAL